MINLWAAPLAWGYLYMYLNKYMHKQQQFHPIESTCCRVEES
jgi:hypothetical protein